MKGIGEFFKRIGGVQAKEIALRGSIQAVIKEFIGTDVPLGDITVKSGVVTIKNIPHSARSVIYIQKNKIISKANTLLGLNQQITDIR